MSGQLLCSEEPMDTARSLAHNDAVIFRDERVLDSLLRTERAYMAGGGYFQSTQNDIQPYMRKMVTSWMLEVRTCRPPPSPHSPCGGGPGAVNHPCPNTNTRPEWSFYGRRSAPTLEGRAACYFVSPRYLQSPPRFVSH